MTREAGSDDEAVLVSDLQRLADILHGAHQTSLTAQRLVDLSQQVVPSSDAVSLTYVRANQRPHTLAGTDPISFDIDALQYDLGEGPCLEAITESDLTHSPNLAADEQWPKFGPRAAEAGVSSAFAVRLVLDAGARGALNFFARRVEAFTDLDLAVGTLLATHVTHALRTEQLVTKLAQLEVALESNRRVGTAMGILMARKHWTAEQAFAALRVASQHLNRKLRDIADEVAYTGELPDHP
ncbi:MAG: ANTAR domain-containing protein [Jatrophihabitantaceae bacterium]